MINKCVRCGTEFEAKHKTAVCANCRTAVCVICGKEFKLAHPYTQKTCSSACRGKYCSVSGISKAVGAKLSQKYIDLGGKPEVEFAAKKCKLCGKEFKPTSANQRYCTDDHMVPCPVCGKLTKLRDIHAGPQACSEACRQARISATVQERYGTDCVFQSEDIKEKIKSTNLAKYGYEHYASSPEGVAKREATMVERYGVTVPLQNPEIKAKARQTCMDRYGVPYAVQSPHVRAKMSEILRSKFAPGSSEGEDILERRVQTNLSRYGAVSHSCTEAGKQAIRASLAKYYVSDRWVADSLERQERSVAKFGVPFSSQRPEVRAKIEQSNLAKYGVDCVFKSDEIKAKIAESNIRKYECPNPMQNAAIQERAAATCMERYGSRYWGGSVQHYELAMTDPSKLDSWLAFKEAPEAFISQHFDTKPTCLQIATLCGVDRTPVDKVLAESGCRDLVSYSSSKIEDDVCDMIQTICSTDIIKRSRSIISPYEIDIYLPEFNLGIECNPTYTHNSSFGSYSHNDPLSPSYHKRKTDLAERCGIELLHIFGYQWSSKQPVIYSMLEHRLGKTPTTIYARKCEVREVPHMECIQFLEQNHIQGAATSKIRLGLYHKDELVSVMTFSHPRGALGYTSGHSTDVWELTRFASVLRTSVVGGASKLFKHFIEKYSPEVVTSFSDKSCTTGGVYAKLGFTKNSEVYPGYCWVRVADDTVLSRVACQKNKLRELFNDPYIDVEHQTERQIMEAHGFAQVYNSGLIKWVWRPAGVDGL